MIFPSKNIVDFIRKRFPVGSRVELEYMNDPYRDIPSGTKGTVRSVDDTGTIHIKWDNGMCLGVVYGEDSVRRIE